MAGRHSWRDPVRFPNKTERECRNGCVIMRVTRHEGGAHWVEFWRDGEKISKGRMPPCEPVVERVGGG